VFKVSATSEHTHTWSQTVAPLVKLSLDNILFKVNPSLRQAFLQVTDVTNLCFVHALLHNTPNFIIYKSISMKPIRYIWRILGNIPCNITFSLFRISQGSVATLIRWGGWNSYHHMCHSSLNLTVKTALKCVDFYEVTDKNKLAPFYGSRCRWKPAVRRSVSPCTSMPWSASSFIRHTAAAK